MNDAAVRRGSVPRYDTPVMERTLTIDRQALEQALRLSAQDRLRQANAALRLHYALHHPYRQPWTTRDVERGDRPCHGGRALRQRATKGGDQPR